MNRKLWVVLLVLTFMLGSISSFWSKPAQASTEEKRRECVCAAEPWDDGGWDKVTSPPDSQQNPANSSTNFVRPGDQTEPQKVQQTTQSSFWARVRLFFVNLRVLFGCT